MAEAQSKRQREETQVGDLEENKRHKPYTHILSLLEEEEEEEEPTQDLSSLINTLQEELSSDSAFDPVISCPTTKTQTNDQEQENHHTTVTITIQDYSSSSSSISSTPDLLREDEEDERERVIRHLLEASDDELGIPNREGVAAFEDGEGGGGGFVDVVHGGDGPTLVDGFSLCDGLWEFEDVNANYYALVQSELFM